MNFSGFPYSFDKNIKSELTTFLKTVRQADSNIFCNFDEYNRLKQYFSLVSFLNQVFQTKK